MSGELEKRTVLPVLGQWLDAESVRRILEEHGQADAEAAHSVLDDLMRDVLRAIADGHPEPARLAAACLHVESAEFPRWCA